MNRKLNIFYHKEVQGAVNKKFKTGSLYCLFLIILLFNYSLGEVSSQVPFTAKEIGSEFNRGMELFNKEKYPAAIRLFDSFIKNGDKSNLILVSDAEYYSSIAALKAL